ncbi:hypothetical protein ACFUGD_12095 [Streptomyces sp. NPDC057217]|uniref:hypothetical protein n=1 Tax=Streptomyces sp. NPDC057217 TaxID=3346054 RepID=UPI00363448FC
MPLPPEPVGLWREGADTFGTAGDGRLFFGEKVGILGSATYDRARHDARELALPPGLRAALLANGRIDVLPNGLI